MSPKPKPQNQQIKIQFDTQSNQIKQIQPDTPLINQIDTPIQTHFKSITQKHQQPLPFDPKQKTSNDNHLIQLNSHSFQINQKRSSLQLIQTIYKQSLQYISEEETQLLEKIQKINNEKNDLIAILSIKEQILVEANQRIDQIIIKNKKNQSQLKAHYENKLHQLQINLQNIQREHKECVQLRQKQLERNQESDQSLYQRYQSNIQEPNKKCLSSPTLQGDLQQIFKIKNIISTQLNNVNNDSLLRQTQLLTSEKLINQIYNQQNLLLKKQLTLHQYQMLNNSPKHINQVDQNTYLLTTDNQNKISSLREIGQIQELKHQIRLLEHERNHIIETEVLKALKVQEEEFNLFYKENMQKLQQHFLYEIIPQRLRQFQEQFEKKYTENKGAKEKFHQTSQGLLQEKLKESNQKGQSSILQAKQKQLLQTYQTTELQKRYQQWEKTHLKQAILKQKNKWIIDQIIGDKIKEVNSRWEIEINQKIKDVDQYWQQVIMPQAISQHLQEWNLRNQEIINLKIRDVEIYWTNIILPQKQIQWQKQMQQKNQQKQIQRKYQHQQKLISQISHQQQMSPRTTHNLHEQMTPSYTASDLQRILSEEHRKWEEHHFNQLKNIQQQYKRELQHRQIQYKKKLQEAFMQKQNMQAQQKGFDTKQEPQQHSEIEKLEQLSLWTKNQFNEEKNKNINIFQTQETKNFFIQSLVKDNYVQSKLQQERLRFLQEKNLWEYQRNRLNDQIQKWIHVLEEEIFQFRKTVEPLIVLGKNNHQKVSQKDQQQQTQSYHQNRILLHDQEQFKQTTQKINQRTPFYNSTIQAVNAQLLINNQSLDTIHLNNIQKLKAVKQEQAEKLCQLSHQKSLLMSQVKELNSVRQEQAEKLSHLSHQKSLLMSQVKKLQRQLCEEQVQDKDMNLSPFQLNYQKQLLSLQSTIKTKQSQVGFLKKSLQNLTEQNQQLYSRLPSLNMKISQLQNCIDQLRGHIVKLEYEVKYLKQKEMTFTKKVQVKQNEFNEVRQRLELEKSLLQKKIRESSTLVNSVGPLQLKVNELQSQLSTKSSSFKTLQNQLEGKKRQLEDTIIIYNRQINHLISNNKQNQSLILELKSEVRKSTEEIQKHKIIIETLINKEKNILQQLKTYEQKPRESKDYLEFNNREVEKLKNQNYKLKEHLLLLQSTEKTQLNQLKLYISQLEHQLHSSAIHYREGDITQIEILKRINTEISDLLQQNKTLQMRLIILQNQKQLSTFGISLQHFFVAFQNQMDNLLNYFINNQLFSVESLQFYNKFLQKSREYLQHGFIEDYFKQWQIFMQRIVKENFQFHVRNVNKQKINLNNQREQRQGDDIVQKYETVLNDVKFSLGAFLSTGDQDYLDLMRRSLGLNAEKSQDIEENIKTTKFEDNGGQNNFF